MSQAERPSALVKTWIALGAPSGAERCLLLSQQDTFELARTVMTGLKPKALMVQTQRRNPTPRSRYETTAARLDDISGVFDLVLVAPGMERGGLFATTRRMERLRSLCAPGAAICLSLPTLSHGGDSATDLEDRLLFPHLPHGRARADLPAAAWVSLLHAARFDVVRTQGYGAAPLPKAIMRDHGVRLSAYDEVELSTPRLDVLARPAGTGA